MYVITPVVAIWMAAFMQTSYTSATVEGTTTWQPPVLDQTGHFGRTVPEVVTPNIIYYPMYREVFLVNEKMLRERSGP